MRSVLLSVPVWLMLGAAALAQGAPPAPGNPPPLPPPNAEPSVPANPPPTTAMPPQGEQPGTMGGREPLSARPSNIGPQDQGYGRIAPALPSPELGPNASPADYLRAAQAALAAGRTGEAQQSLEMAQTRLLDRSVPYGQVNTPVNSPAISAIGQALQALSAGNTAQCMQLIQVAIPQAEAAR